MILTFTSEFEHQAKEQTKNALQAPSSKIEPSKNTIDRILNYSKNLEIQSSKFMPSIEFLKS